MGGVQFFCVKAVQSEEVTFFLIFALQLPFFLFMFHTLAFISSVVL